MKYSFYANGVTESGDTGGGGIPEVYKQTLKTDDQPGTGINVLADGESRTWVESSTGKTYHVTYVNNDYKLVELNEE